MVEPGGDVWPSKHLAQFETEVLPVSEVKVPAGQSVHPVVDVPYLPALHAVHTVARVVFVYLPGGHAVHVALLDAPDAVEKVPAGQSWQKVALVAPTVGEKVPWPHATQALMLVMPVLSW